MFCWFGGGMQLGLFDRISELFAEVEESLWCSYSISMGGDQQWNRLYCCWAVFLLEISFEDRSIGSCYTSVISTQKRLFPKESSCQLQELSCRVSLHWNGSSKVCTWEMSVVREYSIEPYIAARYNLCKTGMAWFRFITSTFLINAGMVATVRRLLC